MAAPHVAHATSFASTTNTLPQLEQQQEDKLSRRRTNASASATDEDLPGTIRLFSEYDIDADGNKTIILTPPPTDSPNDPLNWSLMRKTWSSALVLFITALTAATSNSAGAAGTALVDEFNIGWGVQNTAAGS